MSIVRPVLNLWLRWTEKKHLERVTDVGALRRSFETKARLFFRAPRGSRWRLGSLGGVPVLWVNEAGEGPLILYLHGGAYVMGSPHTHRAMLAWLTREAGLPACLPDYRLAPENPFPAALEDVLVAYRAMMDRPGGVVIGGDSAGGGLALSLLAEILRSGLRKPLGVFAFSPLTDMSFTGDSVAQNARADVILPASRLPETVDMYLPDGMDPREPGVSPLWADFDGACPVWLTASDTEFLLDDTRRMAERLRHQGVAATEVIERDLPHAWPLFHNILPEARRTLRAVARWIRTLSPPASGS